jgi:hypothetical protein
MMKYKITIEFNYLKGNHYIQELLGFCNGSCN